MAHRTFFDAQDRSWNVWSVIPTKVERRVSGPNAKIEFPDRRASPEYRARLGNGMAAGWLCFETDGQKRRLAPIPPTWETAEEEDLRDFCEAATKVVSAVGLSGAVGATGTA